MVAFIIILFIIYVLGIVSINLLIGAALQEYQRKKFRRWRRNPIICFVFGILSPIFIVLTGFDEAFIMEHTGYVDGREARDEVARRKAEQIDAQNQISGYRN